MDQRFGVVVLIAASIGLLACKRSPDSARTGDTSGSASAAYWCAGGARDISLMARLDAVHEARAAELYSLLEGSTKRVLAGDGGADQHIEELSRYPSCAPSSDALLRDRIARALDAFFTKKDARAHKDQRERVSISVGCEEDGRLPVSLGLGLGVGEGISATYQVDERSAKMSFSENPIAHADLDGDGYRELIVPRRGSPLVVRVAGSGSSLSAPPIPDGGVLGSSEDTDYSYVGVPSLESGFGVVYAYRAPSGGSTIETRLRWDGKKFVVVERLDDDFEARYAAAHARERAVLNDPMFGDFGKLMSDLLRCVDVSAVDLACTAVVENATGALKRGGFAETEARMLLRGYLGWQPCPAQSVTTRSGK